MGRFGLFPNFRDFPRYQARSLILSGREVSLQRDGGEVRSYPAKLGFKLYIVG
jgi:hypothetical protein